VTPCADTYTAVRLVAVDRACALHYALCAVGQAADAREPPGRAARDPPAVDEHVPEICAIFGGFASDNL